jgi:RNA polymerase sigma factor (sigma-70 family)
MEGPQTNKANFPPPPDAPDFHARWGTFWKLYAPVVAMYLRRFRLHAEDMDDLSQNMAIKLLEEMPRFQYDQKKRFRGWLRTLTDRLVLDWFRSQARESERLEEIGQYLAAVQKFLGDGNQAELTRRKEWLMSIATVAMETAKAEVKGTTWACFEQSVLRGQPAADVARELGIAKPNNVYVYVFRVLQRVREIAAEMGAFGEFDEEAETLPHDPSSPTC